jgi:phosphatidylserine/phosphatidylglycerophosphate/cardiolipin synthase-like enzyme
VLVDGELSLVGTVNLDMRSLWLNFEITLVIDDDPVLAAIWRPFRMTIFPVPACWMPDCG